MPSPTSQSSATSPTGRGKVLSDLAALGHLAFCIGKGKKLKLVSFILLCFIFLSGHRVQAGIQNHPVKAFS